MEENTTARDDSGAYDETYRPQFHFTAPTGLLNGPNGLVYYAGEYHLFFERNPFGNDWGNMTWGHSVSDDLFHWRALPNAIEPDRTGTVFSGSAVVDIENTAELQSGSEAVIVSIYTAAGGSSPESHGLPFTQCLAYSNDRGRTWHKYASNPVLPHIVGENRDPKVVWYAPGHLWVMALFLDGESFSLFTSRNLKRWTRIQTLSMRGSECPDFFSIRVEGEPSEERWIFMAANGHYQVGSFDGTQFVPEAGQLTLDHGANYYAMQTCSNVADSDGRIIQIAWMAGGVYPDMPFDQQMSIPSVLTLRRRSGSLQLCRNPAAEIESLYINTSEWGNLLVAPGENPLSRVEGDLFDLTVNVDFEESAAAGFGLRIRGEEIRYSIANRTISCLGRAVIVNPEATSVKIRVLIDRTSIELFVDDGILCMSFCFTPPSTNRSLEFFAEGSAVNVRSIQLNTLKSAWAAC